MGGAVQVIRWICGAEIQYRKLHARLYASSDADLLFDVEPLYVIKGVGICLDYVLAIVAAKLIAPEDSKYKQVLLFSAVLLLPTVIANSGVWGQCDNIYTIFILTALYIAMKEKTLTLHVGGKK